VFRARAFPAAMVLMVLVLCLPARVHAQKLVFVVRHAERADGGAPQSPGNPDPPLSAAGAARAAMLAQMLSDADIKAIYVTEYRRTQETGRPLAAKLGLTARQVESKDIEGLVNRLRKEHPVDIVLVVGHSNTIPGILKALGARAVDIADNEYDNLFLVVPGTGIMTRIRFEP
jgi:broad specificity phosphatase PhoE